MAVTTKTTATAAALALVACVAAACLGGALGETHVRTFEQPVDNFNNASSETWPQRYRVVDDYWQAGKGRPVFVFLAGEAPMEFFEFQTVQIRTTWAQQFGALYVSLEHRFYSTSAENNPRPDFGTENLTLLSSDQAIADAVNFIEWHKRQPENAGSKYVIFGCSYSAGVAAWFRARHPDLVVGAVSPSGPVQATYNYTSFFDKFPSSAGQPCAAAARAGAAQITSMVKDPAGLGQLQRAFNTCEPLTPQNMFYFLWSITSDVGSADQMNNPSDDPATSFILNTTCALLQREGYEPYENFAAATAFNAGQEAAASAVTLAERLARRAPVPAAAAAAAEQCVSYDEAAWLKGLRDPSNPNRSWWFQKCASQNPDGSSNTFGYFKPSYVGTSVFVPHLPVEHIAGYCAQMFGNDVVDNSLDAIAARCDLTNQHYGGKNLEATNVLFTNGHSDPWSLLSITESQPSGGVQAVMYDAGHCAPLTAASRADPPSLVAARKVVATHLADWLKQ